MKFVVSAALVGVLVGASSAVEGAVHRELGERMRAGDHFYSNGGEMGMMQQMQQQMMGEKKFEMMGAKKMEMMSRAGEVGMKAKEQGEMLVVVALPLDESLLKGMVMEEEMMKASGAGDELMMMMGEGSRGRRHHHSKSRMRGGDMMMKASLLPSKDLAMLPASKESFDGGKVFDRFTESLVCICEQVVRTRPSADEQIGNICAEKYCSEMALKPSACGKKFRSEEDFSSAGQLERCVVANNAEQCYLYFPDLSDRAVTQQYFQAIAHCFNNANSTTSSTAAPEESVISKV